ncbi:MAG: NUDIX domain-containing protein [Anaerolineaceae bacterium]|nr:NUDIX domain-containing protein [Anaerolineaceae bacterium]
MTRAHFPVAVHLFFFRGDCILLLRRFNTGFGDGQYSLPAGHLDGGETVKEACIREALEEIGVRIEESHLSFSAVMHRMEGDERVDFFFTVEAWEGELFNAEPHKCDNLCWAEINALPLNVIPYVRRALENYQKGIQFDDYSS